MKPPKLYHYTCTHARKRIGTEGVLRPHRHPLLGADLVWLTTNPRPSRAALGLTNLITPCDRLACRYVVTELPPDADRWTETSWWYEPAMVATLEQFARPAQWWVSNSEVPVKLDRTWKGAR